MGFVWAQDSKLKEDQKIVPDYPTNLIDCLMILLLCDRIVRTTDFLILNLIDVMIKSTVGPHHSMAWWRSTTLIRVSHQRRGGVWVWSNLKWLGVWRVQLCFSLGNTNNTSLPLLWLDQFPVTVVVHSCLWVMT